MNSYNRENIAEYKNSKKGYILEKKKSLMIKKAINKI